MTTHTLTADAIITPDGLVIPRDLRDPVYVAWLTEKDPAPSFDTLVAHIQSLMDQRAQEFGYDDLKTAITYRGDPNPKFAAEAEAFFLWRSAVWTEAYAHFGLVQAGQAPVPTLDAALAMIPVLVMPEPNAE